MDQRKDVKFSMEAFRKLLREKRVSLGLTWLELSLRSQGGVSAQALNLYSIGNRFPGKSNRWLPLIKLFNLSKEEVRKIDRRPGTAAWLQTISDDDLKPYPTNDWRARLVTKEDLQFLLQVSEGLTAPLTLGLVMELIDKR